MNWSKLIRKSHRLLSMLFIGTVLAASFAAASKQEADSILYYLPLLPLLLLMVSGLYLFAQPHIAKWRGKTASTQEA